MKRLVEKYDKEKREKNQDDKEYEDEEEEYLKNLDKKILILLKNY
jgi:hypothetical protein